MHTISSCTRVLCACCTLALALVLGLGPTCHAQNSAVNFTSSQPVPLPSLPQSSVPGNQQPPEPACTSLFTGKFHPGSRLDFLATCIPVSYDNPFNSALLNQGNGLFNYVDDSQVDSVGDITVATADLNGDGFTDLVLNPVFSSTIGVQLSNGDGTFKAPVNYTASGVPSGSGVVAAAIGDFEHNGHMDVAILTNSRTSNTSSAATNLTIFINDGSGKLTQSATYTLPPTASGDQNPILAAGDLNGDQKVDLAVVYRHSSGTAIPFLSQGNGKFTEGGTFNAGPSPVSAVIGNFNDDAYGDIAVSTSAGVNVLIGNSSASFTTSKSSAYPTPLPSFGLGEHLVRADFDKDGKLDVALTTPNDIYVFWGAGDGTFGSYSAYSIPNFEPTALVTASLNNNGRNDLAVASSSGSVDILYNIASRVFRATPNTHSLYSAGIVAADFNGDGKKDIAVVNTPTCKAPCDGTVSVFPGAGTYFSAGKTYTIGMHGEAIAAGDLNGDGVLDLVVTNATSGDNADTSILLGIKGGGFQTAHNITLGSLSNDAYLADVNGDGKLDLVEDGGVALGDGKGDFGKLTPFPDGMAFAPPATNGLPGFPNHLAVADFSGDGHPDVVTLFTPSGGQQQADVLINDGKGHFTATPLNGFDAVAGDFGDSGTASGVNVGRLNGGSINDIIFAVWGGPDNSTDAGAYVFINDGKGNFTPGPNAGVGLPGQNSPIGAAVIADFNHDGKNDIGFSAGNEFYVATGPSFNTHTIYFAESNPIPNMAVADLNNDGWPDVVFTSSYGISRLYNVPVPTVTPGSLTFNAGGTQKVTIKNTLSSTQSITVGLLFGGTAPPGGTNPFKISSNTCGTLKAGATCSISVEYLGAAHAGGTLYISANGSFIAGVPVNSN